MPYEQLDHLPMKSKIATSIRDEILNGALKPGAPIREAHVAERMGVSRGPVREALADLEDEGLVVSYPYRGRFVNEVSASQMQDLAGVRQRLEPYAVELALPRVRAEASDVISRPLEMLEMAASREDRRMAVDAHLAFHRAFYEASQNALLPQLWSSWEAQLRLYLAFNHLGFLELTDLADVHRGLFETVMTGTMKDIRQSVASHFTASTRSPSTPASASSR